MCAPAADLSILCLGSQLCHDPRFHVCLIRMDWPQMSQPINNHKQGWNVCYDDVWVWNQDPLFNIHSTARKKRKKTVWSLIICSKSHNLTLLDITSRQIQMSLTLFPLTLTFLFSLKLTLCSMYHGAKILNKNKNKKTHNFKEIRRFCATNWC